MTAIPGSNLIQKGILKVLIIVKLALIAINHIFTDSSAMALVMRGNFNLLKTERRPLYLKAQSIPRCKHFSSRL
jgi:hypothetical protein